MAKSLKLYQEQYLALKKQIGDIQNDMVQVLAEALNDGFHTYEVTDPPKISPEAPGFDL